MTATKSDIGESNEQSETDDNHNEETDGDELYRQSDAVFVHCVFLTAVQVTGLCRL